MNINVNKICKKPFIYCEIQPDGNVYPCCPAYCGYYSFGNIYESTLEEIWNNEKARTFRNNILNHNYKYCDLKYCMAYNAFSEHEALPDVNTKIYPQILAVSCDRECNVACITCRDSIIRNNKEDEERLEKFTNNIWSVLPKIKYFYISGSGDPFGSRYARNLIKTVSSSFADIKFDIHTNGILCTEKMCDELNIKNKINSIMFSIHASNQTTYDKIVKYGNFNKVMENIKWLSREKAKGNIKNIELLFVVHALNYKDMPSFVRIAKKYNIHATFTSYRDWGSGYSYKNAAVFEPWHEKYNDLCSVLSDKIFDSKFCSMDNILCRVKKSNLKNKNSHSNRIFSVSKEKNHVVVKIFGIKMKFKNTHN